MTVLYVASDQEAAGKTAFCATLAHKLRQRGTKVAVMKPVSGAADNDPDVDIYAKLVGQSVEGRPVDLPDGGRTSDIVREVKDAVTRALEGTDVVLVEGSSGLSGEASLQIADALDARVLVIARYRHDLSGSHLKTWRDLFGERLVGFVINGLTRYMGNAARNNLQPSLESEGLVNLGVIPEDRRLLGTSVRQLAEHLEGRFIVCEEGSDALVEHLLVGGMGMDPGELYFGLRENKAVIARGDRPDVQMAALNTPTACIVMTKGIEPIEYVRYEAEQEEVPVVIVQTDTLSTMAALNSLMERARFDHPLKLSRFAELLDEHVDLAAIYSALGLGNQPAPSP